MIKQPKGIEVHREFEPDMKRMVHALKIVLEAPPVEPKQDIPAAATPVKEESARRTSNKGGEQDVHHATQALCTSS